MISKERGSAAPAVYERTFHSDGEKILTVMIAYPLADRQHEGRGLRRIEKFYRRVFGSFQKYCLTQLREEAENERNVCKEQGSRFYPFKASLSYSVTYNKDGILSIFYDRREEKEPTERFLARYSETWHARSGRLYELKEFCGNSRHWKRDSISAITQAAADAVLEGTDFLYPDYAKLIAKYFSARRFYLTDKGIAVYYQPCTLGPVEEGIPVFEIPAVMQSQNSTTS